MGVVQTVGAFGSSHGRLLCRTIVCGQRGPPISRSSIGEVLDFAASKAGNRAALVFPTENGRRIGFSELAEKAKLVARSLCFNLGLQPGDRVALAAPTCERWLLMQYAAAKAALVLVPMNDRCHPLELDTMLTQTGCSTMIAHGAVYEKLASLEPHLKGHPGTELQSSRYPKLRHVVSVMDDGPRGTLKFAELLRDSAHVEDLPDPDPDDIAYILQSSGSTGTPKSIPLSHSNIVNEARFLCLAYGLSVESRVCCVMPLFHCFGLVNMSVLGVVNGVETVYLPAGSPPEQVLITIQDYECTSFQGTPTTFYDLLNFPALCRYSLSKLCHGVVGATIVQDTVLQRIQHGLGIDHLWLGYGLTETAGACAVGQAGGGGYELLPHTEGRLVDSDGNTLPPGVVGELVVRGPTVFRGYWKQMPLGPEGWLHTGDLARITTDGLVEICGRQKDLIIKGGVNINPEEVEAALIAHEAVAEASVIGVPDPRFGEELCAWVRLAPSRTELPPSPDDLRSFCSRYVSRFKLPKHIIFVDDFPRTSVGKISKPEIRRIMAEEMTTS